MKAAFYRSLTEAMRRTPFRERCCVTLCRWLPWVVAVLYGGLLLWLLLWRDPRALRCVAVPALTFLCVSVLRRLINLPRPYETISLTPLLSPRHAGQSLPSRHAASAVILALTGWYIHPVIGTVLTVLAVLVCVSRVAAGLHFVRDVVVAVLLSGLLGGLGFWLIV